MISLRCEIYMGRAYGTQSTFYDLPWVKPTATIWIEPLALHGSMIAAGLGDQAAAAACGGVGA